MSLDNKFDLPKDISLGKAMVCAASLGWSSKITLKAQRNKISAQIWLTHHAWHGTLCEVTGVCAAGLCEVEIYPEIFMDAETALRDAIVSCLPGLQELWARFTDSVPCLHWNTKEWVVNTMETDAFHQYKAGSRRVVAPERMNPVFFLPGWEGQQTIGEYVEKGYMPVGTFADFLSKIHNLSTGEGGLYSMAHINLYPETYYGDAPVGASWNMSMFGFDLSKEMKMEVPSSHNPTRCSLSERGGATCLSFALNRMYNAYKDIASDIISGRETDIVKKRPRTA